MTRANKPTDTRRSKEGECIGSAGREAEERNVLRVPSEARHVSLNPSERKLLIHHSVIRELVALVKVEDWRGSR